MAMGITEMNSLLSSANTLKNVRNSNATRTQMNGQSRILSAEIKADKSRGLDTKKKEEELGEMGERLQNIDRNIMGSLTELNERLEADREKIRKEEAEENRQAEKAADTHKAEQRGSTGVSGSGDVTASIIASVDTVEISPEARAAAASATESEAKPRHF